MHRKESGRVTNEMRMWVRGHQMRVGDISGLKGYVLYDQQAQTITQVDEAQKVYRVVDEQAIANLKATLQAPQSVGRRCNVEHARQLLTRSASKLVKPLVPG